MSSAIPLVNPVEIRRRLEAVRSGDVFRIEHRQYYLPGTPSAELVVAAARDSGQRLRLVISDRVADAGSWLARHRATAITLDALAEHIQAPVLDIGDACKLVPVHIAKPWGREIWFTGIEARGQSMVTDGKYRIPLPWLLALGDTWLLDSRGGEPNLLKILDPLPEPVFGDLYFELHREKREVYVVTGIDASAWPDGRGAIRYGFDQDRRRRAGNDETFRRRYLDAVRTYEKIRRDIDARLDRIREKNGIGLREPVDAATLKAWLAEIPGSLRREEENARREMDSFTSLYPLEPGDVVKVARLTPHALQHGVRTVEFQTPVYEREIISFAQKVLTQDHWDTEAAVAMMNLDGEPGADLAVLSSGDAYTLEQVVRFDDFQALRVTLSPGAGFPLDRDDHYAVVMAIEGRVEVGATVLDPEEAALVPRTAAGCRLRNVTGEAAVCLISMPVSDPR